MHPWIIITIDGKPVSGLFLSRLLSVTVTDREGDRSDTVDLELEAGPPFLAIPRKKAIITVHMGYFETGVEFMGSFTADDVTLDVLPYRMKIQGKSADMRASLKQHKDRHWDDKTAKDVLGQIAQENGLQLQIAEAIGSIKLPYWNQENESGLHFANRQAKRLGGIMAIKDGRMIVAEKGKGQTPGGAAMMPVVITPPMIIKGSCSVRFAERESHKKVRGAFHDSAEAKRKYADADVNPEGEAVYTLRHPYANKDEAEAAAKSKAADLKRDAQTTSVEIEGNPYAKAGAPLSYAGVHPEVDALEFTIETAAHTYTKRGGYRAKIDGKAKV